MLTHTDGSKHKKLQWINVFTVKTKSFQFVVKSF